MLRAARCARRRQSPLLRLVVAREQLAHHLLERRGLDGEIAQRKLREGALHRKLWVFMPPLEDGGLLAVLDHRAERLEIPPLDGAGEAELDPLVWTDALDELGERGVQDEPSWVH